MLFNQLIARWYVFNSCSLFSWGSVQSSQSVSDFLVVLRVLRLVKIMRQIKRLVQLHHGALSTQPGAIIGDGDSKRAPFLVFPPWLRPSLSYETFFLFSEKKLLHRACGTRVYMLWEWLQMLRRGNGVRSSRNLLCFWPTAQRVYVCWNFA